MNNKKHFMCNCPECGNKEERILPRIITEEQREAVENMSLFKWTCPHCAHSITLLYPCMYVHESKKILVWLINEAVSEETAEIYAEELWSTKIQGFDKRICASLEEFSEKIRVLESGLDDRAVELLKLLSFASIHIENERMEGIFFCRRNHAGNFEFSIFYGEESEGIEIPGEMYRKILQIVKSELSEPDDRFYRIDIEWAGEQLLHFQPACVKMDGRKES